MERTSTPRVAVLNKNKDVMTSHFPNYFWRQTKILLGELTRDVTLHKGGLTDTTVTDENALEAGRVSSSHFIDLYGYKKLNRKKFFFK